MNSVSINEEMKKNPELKEDIKVLEEWSGGLLHLPKISESDFALFLHCNSYDVEATKEHIENFYTMRTHLPEFFADRDPEKNATLRKTFDRVSVISLEKCTKEGYEIILARLIDTDADNYVFNDAIKYLNMVLDICVHEEGTSDGYVIVVDLNGANISHTTRLTWLGLKKFMLYIHKAAPIKWSSLHQHWKIFQ
ncbi:retinol-binding protein pinta-like [Nasonia vitripennis]|uniref:CRAL-TRIO domain-containing protein n=1 Tax=Nasonia vitripennis TaxID=7425 RepID=A0A7M7HCC3_NASVI|nr:retinol-binding protein pinta-like [Nasonia vitripennis]